MALQSSLHPIGAKPAMNAYPHFEHAPTISPVAPSIAIYWDLENLHGALYDEQHGPGSYASQRFRSQEALVDVATLMAHAGAHGSVAVNRGYANWASLSRYRAATLDAGMDLIQVFSPGANAKNGADIRLCMDLMDDIERMPHIGSVLVVAGDSDYLPLAMKLKASGRRLLGVGGRHSTNPYWAKACHEFRYYDQLVATNPLATVQGQQPVQQQPARAAAQRQATSALPAAGAPTSPTPATAAASIRPTLTAVADVADVAGTADTNSHESAPAPTVCREESPAPKPVIVQTQLVAQPKPVPVPAAPAVKVTTHAGCTQPGHELVMEALHRLRYLQPAMPWVTKSFLRGWICRHLEPAFDEALYGYASFSDLLQAVGPAIDRRRGVHGAELRLAPAAARTRLPKAA